MSTSTYWKSASNGDGVGSYFKERYGNIQPHPYVRPLSHRWTSHDIIQAKATGVYMSGFGGMANASANRGNYLFSPYCLEYASFDSLVTQATNKVLDKFYNQLDEQAMLAVNFAERVKSIDMMTARLFQLARFARALRKFDLITAAKSLGLDPSSGIPHALKHGPRPSRWRSAKDRSKIVANAWLEFHFGWEPLVKDIFNAIEVLESPTLEKTVKEKSGVTMNLRDYQNPYGESYLRETSGFVAAKVGATLLVTDYNAFAASRLGLTNPAAWAWELIPFSFVADWFATVGSFINQWSDLDGYSLINPWYTTTIVANKCTYEKRYLNDYLTVKSVGVLSRRLLNVPRYKVAWRPLKRLSMVRAATAIALLTQFLP